MRGSRPTGSGNRPQKTGGVHGGARPSQSHQSWSTRKHPRRSRSDRGPAAAHQGPRSAARHRRDPTPRWRRGWRRVDPSFRGPVSAGPHRSVTDARTKRDPGTSARPGYEHRPCRCRWAGIGVWAAAFGAKGLQRYCDRGEQGGNPAGKSRRGRAEQQPSSPLPRCGRYTKPANDSLIGGEGWSPAHRPRARRPVSKRPRAGLPGPPATAGYAAACGSPVLGCCPGHKLFNRHQSCPSAVSESRSRRCRGTPHARVRPLEATVRRGIRPALTPDAPPLPSRVTHLWEATRDRWAFVHTARTTSSLAGLTCLAAAALSDHSSQ